MLSLGIMSRRRAIDIKKDILRVLKQNGELSLRDIDIKVNTNSHTIKTQIDELEFFDKVEIIKHPKNDKNGRPFTTVRLK